MINHCYTRGRTSLLTMVLVAMWPLSAWAQLTQLGEPKIDFGTGGNGIAYTLTPGASPAAGTFTFNLVGDSNLIVLPASTAAVQSFFNASVDFQVGPAPVWVIPRFEAKKKLETALKSGDAKALRECGPLYE